MNLPAFRLRALPLINVLIALLFFLQSLLPGLALAMNVKEYKRLKGDSQALQQMMKKIITANDLPIPRGFVVNSYVYRDEVVNAYTDGRAVYFTKILWDALENDDARAFVVGHELGHVMNKHTSRKVVAGKIAAIGAGVFFAGIIGGTAAYLITKKIGRKGEYQADSSGVLYMERAGYNKHAALEAMEVLYHNEDTYFAEEYEYKRSHPVTENRIVNLVSEFGLDVKQANVWDEGFFPAPYPKDSGVKFDFQDIEYHKPLDTRTTPLNAENPMEESEKKQKRRTKAKPTPAPAVEADAAPAQ